MKGMPTDHPLFSTYWRKSTPPPAEMDPDRDGCGLLWCSPVVPNRGRNAIEVSSLATELVLRHGYEPAISLTVLPSAPSPVLSPSVSIAMLPEKMCVRWPATVTYSAPGERGYHSYRLSVDAMPAMGPRDSYVDLLHGIKATVDPAGILSPGRYISDRSSHRENGTDGCRESNCGKMQRNRNASKRHGQISISIDSVLAAAKE